ESLPTSSNVCSSIGLKASSSFSGMGLQVTGFRFQVSGSGRSDCPLTPETCNLIPDMAKALVTGGTGFIGGAIVRELVANGEQVKVFRRESSPLTNLEGLDVEHAIGDLLDRGSLVKALE